MVTIGSISTGTTRTIDLLARFSHYVQDKQMRAEAESLIELFDNDGWQSWDEEQAEELLSDMFDDLEQQCLPFVYFGAHPGDGADYGFWPDWEAISDATNWEPERVCTCGNASHTEDCLYDNSEYQLVEGVIIHSNDHGNVTCYDQAMNELWSCV